MRYYLYLIFALFSVSSFAQNVPNGSFEDWQIRDHHIPNSWFATTRNATRTTDAKEGEYALKLENTFNPNNNGTISYARNVDIANGLNGHAFSGDPLSLVFWSKHDIAAGDEARIYMVLRDKGATKGVVDFRFTGSTADTFVRYSIPILWYGSRTPDSAWIYLYSYSTETKVEGDGYVIFDDIHFDKLGERMEELPNANFEDWTNIGVEYPEHWVSFDLLLYDLYTSFLSPNRTSARVTDDAVDGNSSWMVRNYQSGQNPARSYHFSGTKNGDYNLPIFEFKDTFRYLQGYYKYFPDGEDSAYIITRTFKEGASRSYNAMRLGEASEWTFFTLPLTYSQSVLPDSATILFYSAIDQPYGGANSTLYLDGLDLVKIPKSAGLQPLEEGTYVYPNPTSNEVHVVLKHNAHAVILNALGQEVKEQELYAGNNTLYLQEQPIGIYYLKIISDSKQWTTKIIRK